ncbi:hypothetical protein RYA05_25005 [Pseudomonas syringae pv. actinidiae]|uniref:Anaerobic selenocysteine-containing dehydrogenase n=2 Tax=Pseudomonas syringae TaxID=317 RepID=A0AAN4Q248_PSESF|nr:hypothetical protein [Pseudomonas syringae]EPN56838.1 hypothetical protein A235_33732 [Pseudomonas syringae pv. actinidiae ICMP 19079]EPN85902.1 hypothetical protein A234_04627 [Pseudomonas syringae pv. actinidiae ICMP 19101]AKT28179.1 hypothetical protein IYO_001395 [Pseudomonas syringae pv. actinidiae ICMP 18884]AOE54740.1 hypothetical protein NZ708_01395 [Pseudomonas syringae pv. actinidiae ICMP 18708]APP95603.1 hypothetical protein PsaNZ45_01395 [Pseudomonas syringae pv. actinidiae]
MQIQVMSELPLDPAVDPVSMVIAGLKRTEHGYPVVHADAYAVDGLLEILDVRAARGEREMMVLQCSREQIQAVLEWQLEAEDAVDLEDLIIHLARRTG